MNATRLLVVVCILISALFVLCIVAGQKRAETSVDLWRQRLANLGFSRPPRLNPGDIDCPQLQRNTIAIPASLKTVTATIRPLKGTSVRSVDLIKTGRDAFDVEFVRAPDTTPILSAKLSYANGTTVQTNSLVVGENGGVLTLTRKTKSSAAQFEFN